ncbi:conjugative transfer protein TraB (plasmid) [Aliivibrio salmonicida LFI1238]|uniref:Conjugative transfer protein TraB n=1 Tax=Aliivibrio salmonicida (strain LFI1238) TaxID=316275 RepID=B6ESX7_ALISL|nr:TrbI/VirB10 family protein [Aliivibrio salmonicida]CAQ81865.1 conjugative transfer protein TraB [Aliivibrio salmonicida LFI1238]
MLNKWLKKSTNDATGSFEQGCLINERSIKRNGIITLVILVTLSTLGGVGYTVTRPSTPPPIERPPVDFGAIIEDDFISADNQSALSAQQDTLHTQERTIAALKNEVNRVNAKLDNTVNLQEESFARFKDKMQATFERQRAEMVLQKKEAPAQETDLSVAFGDKSLPPRAIPSSKHNPNAPEFSYQSADAPIFDTTGIDSYEFNWALSEEEKPKRTILNYVPTGTFVTALVTGGADVNAGVLGQGDTVPMVFQTINAGILPNGQSSRLKDCTITGSSYGEISSSRGIVRTNRMSCIFDDGEIIDLAVKGTVFNFGRNGIRGTTILRNGKIVQMAGLSGILTGIGETGKALSSTTSVSALGSTSSLNGSDAALNLLGNATASVGAKLSDYYIQLAELYHPIVELNPGNVVNIVFLEGFPLDALGIEKYEAKQQVQESRSGNNQLLDVITNNPLANQLPQGVKAAMGAQTAPLTDFGSR